MRLTEKQKIFLSKIILNFRPDALIIEYEPHEDTNIDDARNHILIRSKEILHAEEKKILSNTYRATFGDIKLCIASYTFTDSNETITKAKKNGITLVHHRAIE